MKNVTKANIIQAYVDLHMEIPHNKISMDLLSEKSGYSRRTIYIHFDSKEELIIETLWSELKNYKYIDFANKTPNENGELFYLELKKYREVLIDIFSIPKLMTHITDEVEETIARQKSIPSKIISASVAYGITGAMYEFCKEKTHDISDLHNAIVALIKPYH